MQINKPINITLRLIIPILHQHSRKLILRSIQPLPCDLNCDSFAPAHAAPVGEYVADLGVEVGFEDGEGRGHGVEGLEGGFAGAEEVFEEVGGDVGVEPEEADLAVVDEVGAAFFDAGEGGADGGGDD